MNEPGPGIGTMLRLSRTFAAPRERVFEAWTEPEQVRQWWGIQAGYTAPVVEIDLRVGGAFRLGMQAPGDDHVHVVSGVFREVSRPQRLVYTWTWEEGSMGDLSGKETLVTVEFHERGSSTELVLVHEFFPNEDVRQQHIMGWTAMLDNRFGPVVQS